jgi:hypothetical protein
MKLPQRLTESPLFKRAETLVRDFEWTWTKAVVASLLLWFIAIGTLAIVPSWWLYFAGQKLGWRQPPPGVGGWDFWAFKLRDVVASGLFGTPFLIMIVAPLLLQKWRRRLRSESESRPTGGYR